MSTIEGAHGFQLVEAKTPLRRAEMAPLAPGAGEVVVAIAGCGVCHTDVGFALGEVPTRKPLPLVLGHEIAGRVVAAGAGAEAWLRKSVVVPAVIPCDACPACAAGRPAICRRQFMPGNDGDGGFATHVKVPARGLCPVPDALPAGIALADLSVVADAVTTPLQALHLAGVGPDDVTVFVGAGGVGGFGVQIAAARGAAVVALDVDPARLDLATAHGAGLALDARGTETATLRTAVREFAKRSGRKGIGLKVFETSGTPQGQITAFALVDHGGYLGVVGYSPEKVALRLSNLMALDATARGNWGCPPALYPEALGLVLDGRVRLEPYVERHPLDRAPEVLDAVARHSIRRRAVLVP